MAQIEQRESGFWQARIRRRGHKTVSQTFQTREAAEQWARATEREMDIGAYVPTSAAQKTTFKDLADEFEKEFAPHHYRSTAWKTKLNHLRARLGSISLIALNRQVVTDYRDARLADCNSLYTKNKNAPLISPATVRGELNQLRKVLDVAQKEFSIFLPAGNPVASIRMPKNSKPRDRRLTPDEWARLETECKASQNTMLYPALLLAVETAMRQGELLSAEWQHVDKKRRLLLLLDTEKIKTGDPRAVPLSSRALAELTDLPRGIKEPRVMPSGRMTLYKAFSRAAQRAGIEDYTWHDLRHESLSRLAERGDMSILELAAISGHKTLQMLKRYTHLQAENLAKKLG